MGSPSDDTDFLDSLECLGKEREEISSSADDGFCCVGELYILGLEDFRGEGTDDKREDEEDERLNKRRLCKSALQRPPAIGHPSPIKHIE